jgi:hypothetical protein
MSLSPPLDERYRLTYADLAGQPRRLRIANVTTQGLEDLVPVLHFDGTTKRLVLTPVQSQQLIALTGSTIFSDWIGQMVILQPRRAGSERQIALQPPDGPVRGHAMPPPRTDDERGWRLALVVVGLVALASLAYIAFNLALFDSYLAPLLP